MSLCGRVPSNGSGSSTGPFCVWVDASFGIGTVVTDLLGRINWNGYSCDGDENEAQATVAV